MESPPLRLLQVLGCIGPSGLHALPRNYVYYKRRFFGPSEVRVTSGANLGRPLFWVINLLSTKTIRIPIKTKIQGAPLPPFLGLLIFFGPKYNLYAPDITIMRQI